MITHTCTVTIKIMVSLICCRTQLHNSYLYNAFLPLPITTTATITTTITTTTTTTTTVTTTTTTYYS